MSTFEKLNLSKPLYRAIADLGFEQPTPIQTAAVPVIHSGRDMVGIAQTGTGKTYAYLWPILRDLKYSDQVNPRVLIVVPTRELVVQVVEQAKSLTRLSNIRVLGVYGGTNINTQKIAVAEGTDILVATPGRLNDLLLHDAVRLNAVRKLVIDEVDVMLDLGFRFQLKNMLEILPKRRQNIMFSATMTEEVDAIIDQYFSAPERISVALSGTPLDNIAQQCYQVRNFYTKLNLLVHLLSDREDFRKVLVFVSSKKSADLVFEALEEHYGSELCVIHSNKTQNYRLRSIKQFEQGENRILVTTDVMARGLDLDKVSHVINFDTPAYPENYMHRIGRTGRAKEEGKAILFYTRKEEPAKRNIESLMDYKIPENEFPKEVEISSELTPDERPKMEEIRLKPNRIMENSGGSHHEKKLKNTKTNQGGSYLRKMKKYKKPKTKGDKNFNRKHKRK
ncbi:MAG: DEAD/DEAH box helicase [Bacteroidales bacterium]